MIPASHGAAHPQGRAQPHLITGTRSACGHARRATAFRIEKQAPSADSRGRVAALTAAVRSTGNELVAWEEGSLERGRARCLFKLRRCVRRSRCWQVFKMVVKMLVVHR